MQKDTLQKTAAAHASKRGAFSAGLVALAIAAVILFNLLTAYIPDNVAQFDLTDSGIYDISETSVNYLAEMSSDVELHVLAAEEDVDSRIVRFLDRYAALSDRLQLSYTDPTVYPSVLTTYGAEINSIVVLCPDTGLQEIIDISDIIGFDEMSYYYYGTMKETDFDGEGLLTSAVDSVLTGTSLTAYQTTGHDESPLSDSIREQLRKSHMALESVSLLMEGGVPQDCDLLILNAPARDLADDERTMVEDYLSTGGHVLYAMASQTAALPNFDQLCAGYGIQVQEGMIADLQRYYQNQPYWIFPVADTTSDVDINSDALILFCASRGMTLGDPQRDSITVTPLLHTSEDGIAVVSEEEQYPGSYVLAAVATEEIDDNLTARFTVLGADSLSNSDLLGSFTNLDNSTLFLSIAAAGFDDISPIRIDPVNLEIPMNTIPTSGLWSLLFLFVIPGGLLLWGFLIWLRRRKL